MDSPELSEKRQKDYFEKIQKLSLMDDEFMTKCLEDSKECVEPVLHILMGRNDLKVLSVQTQYAVNKATTRRASRFRMP